MTEKNPDCTINQVRPFTSLTLVCRSNSEPEFYSQRGMGEAKKIWGKGSGMP